MDAQTINATVELLPLVGIELHKAGAYYVGPCPMCGGRDRFTLKHTPMGDRWHCRHCSDGKYHGVIDFIMARDRLSFIDACKLFNDGQVLRRQIIQPATTRQPAPTAPDLATQARMLSVMDTAADALQAPDLAAQEYLFARSLNPSTWEAWHIGAAMVYDPKAKRSRPAISIPWYYMDAQREIITAIKYRFIDNDPDGLRYTSAPGSIFVLYGAWSRINSDKTLLLVEGEINALSLWQCWPVGVSVLSIGSEGGGRPDVIAKITAHYKNVFVWCDDPARTLEYKAQIIQPTRGLQSPIVDGVKIDANTLLQRGRLQEFIQAVIGVDCQA